MSTAWNEHNTKHISSFNDWILLWLRLGDFGRNGKTGKSIKRASMFH